MNDNSVVIYSNSSNKVAVINKRRMMENCPEPKNGGIFKMFSATQEELDIAVEEERYEDAAMIKECLDGNIIWTSWNSGILKSWINNKKEE